MAINVEKKCGLAEARKSEKVPHSPQIAWNADVQRVCGVWSSF